MLLQPTLAQHSLRRIMADERRSALRNALNGGTNTRRKGRLDEAIREYLEGALRRSQLRACTLEPWRCLQAAGQEMDDAIQQWEETLVGVSIAWWSA